MKKKTTEQMILAGTEEGEILTRLHERVEKAIATIQDLRGKLEDAERRLKNVKDGSERLAALEDDRDRLQKQRTEIRNRIESMLANLESLDG